MQSSFYVGLSGQLTIEKRLDALANNIANMNTVGFRADGISFDTVLSQTGDSSVAFSTGGTDYISRRAGERVKTDNPLDVAVQGDAWMAVKTPTGVVYTHDGRLKITPAGEVQSLTGNPILDAGGSSLIIDPNGGPPTISADGMISQNSKQIGAIGLFSIDDKATLTRAENSGVIPSVAATPVLDFTKNGVLQGFVENANMNPIMELSKLIEMQHDLEAVTQSNQTADSSQQEAIKTLGSANS